MTTKYIEIDRAIETALLLLEEGEDEQTLAYNAALVAFIKNMENVPAADIEPKWIPCSERLPEEEGQYLVSGKWANKDEEIWICEFVLLCNIRGWCNKADRPVVQAWMSLPSPYRSGDEKC